MPLGASGSVPTLFDVSPLLSDDGQEDRGLGDAAADPLKSG